MGGISLNPFSWFGGGSGGSGWTNPGEGGNPTDSGGYQAPENQSGGPAIDVVPSAPDSEPVEDSDTPQYQPDADSPPPPPASNPAPQYADPSPQETAAQRLKRMSALRLGLARTIKTSPQGVTGSPLVSTPAAYFPGTKGKLGQ